MLLSAKSLVCCSALNQAGALFTGLAAAGSCALALLLLACWWLGRMDRLGGRFGCCHMHSPRDWSVEGQHGDGAEPTAGLQGGDATAGAGAKAARKAAAPSPPPGPGALIRSVAGAAGVLAAKLRTAQPIQGRLPAAVQGQALPS